MNSRSLIGFILLILIFSFSGYSQDISQKEAERIGHNYFYERVNKFVKSRDYNNVKLNHVYSFQKNGTIYFYAFNIEDKGYVIISAFEDIFPIIGYSFNASFPSEIDVNTNYGSFLYSYVEEIEYAQLNSVDPPDYVDKAWKRLKNDDITKLDIIPERDNNVDPLVSSMWNQDNPYNILCPEDPEGPGGHVYAGCVATSMTQIMHYWRYPDKGEGSHSYNAGKYGMQTANFGETEYNWTAMQNYIEYSNPWAIAELQYHAGVSVNMNYSPNGSGASMTSACNAFKNYFRFPDSEYHKKEDYSYSEWIDLLKVELDNSMPIDYAGFSSSGGHAFVCDGYQEDDFHFNFGWGGTSNGYYSLNNVNGFHNWQQCILNIQPDDPDYPFFAGGEMVIKEMSGSITDGSGPIENYKNNTDASWLLDPQTNTDSVSYITLEFFEFDMGENDYINVYDGGSKTSPLIGTFKGSENPDEITSSGNKLLIVFKSDNDGTGKGFYAEFEAELPEYCSGIKKLYADSGTVSDGSGLFNYTNGLACMWLIQPENGEPIRLNFNYFETEPELDYVKVFDSITLIGTYSGNTIPGQITAESGTMFIAFSSSSHDTYNGWEATYLTGTMEVDEIKTINKLDVFPNPATDHIEIHAELENRTPVIIHISSMRGDLVIEKIYESDNGSFEETLNIENLNDGIYVLSFMTNNDVEIRKIIINSE